MTSCLVPRSNGRDPKAVWLVGSCRTDSFVWCKTAQGLELPCEVVAVEERGEMFFELAVSFVVISLNGYLL